MYKTGKTFLITSNKLQGLDYCSHVTYFSASKIFAIFIFQVVLIIIIVISTRHVLFIDLSYQSNLTELILFFYFNDIAIFICLF